MFSKIAVALAAVSLVSAQTSTECNPLKTTCKPDPAFGKNGANCDFTAGACDGFHTMAGKAVTYDSRGAIVAMDAPGQAPTLRSDNYLFFGRVDVEMQAAPGKGIVTSLVLLSDDLDEIDFETVGFDNKQIQSNYFSKGDDSVFDRGGNHAVDNPLGAIHKYTFEWTPEKIDWIINGAVVRTLTRAAVGEAFPQSPMQVKLGAWVAGYEGGRPGTIEWSGGIADFSNGPATAIYKSVKVVDYAGGSSATDKDVKEYVYGDHSGSAKSIKINLKDGSSSTPDASAPASSTTAASSASSASTSSASASASASAPASSSQKSSVTSAKSITTSAAPSIITTEALPTKNSTSTVIAATSSAVNGTNATTTLTTATGSRTSASSTPTPPPTSGASGSGAMLGAAVLLLAALAI
ncbi:ice nucleation protein [Beauveria bassiana ARSEF 2860]|uniref:Crh-like protein n=1 Tax=Beauveria bassiana (strain ARSEF 2860) TaxID=655819 RepID=J4KQ21_BEAB2|nr:ice nucleation protein [Beauveria bassiana ARSEF 2860]EJP68444.1 ice nucleation protein [Beauveria bassiana ARSEF 2860]